MESRHDLHTHSTASDGTLAPAALVREAAAQGVTRLALTDHDSVDGLDEARRAATAAGLDLVPGAELSTSWERKTLHVLGLNIDPANRVLRRGLARLADLRAARAEHIGRKLERAGAPGMLAHARGLAGTQGQLTRSHFARALTESGMVRNPAEAFRRYLGRGKPAAVGSDWPPLEEVCDWIRTAGGTAVLAHPARYRLTRSWLLRLLDAFRQAGGTALEVVSGNATPSEIRQLAGLARRHGFAASAGSDYHGEATPWLAPGRLAPLPADLVPVWQLWNAAELSA